MRIRYHTTKGRKTVILKNPQSVIFIGDEVIRGREVDREGDEMDRFHIIARGLIVGETPMTMNLHYGELEEAGRA